MHRRLLSVLVSLALFGALGCQGLTGRALTASKETASSEETGGALPTSPGSTDLPFDRSGTGPSEPSGPAGPAGPVEPRAVMGATPVSGSLPPNGEPVDVAMRSGVPNRFVPAFGPEVMPPMSDSQDVGHDDKPTARAAAPEEPVVLKSAADLPIPDAFRMILGEQSYSLNELDFALPASLLVRPDGRLNEVFVVQAHSAAGATTEPRWWDIIQGPYVRAIIFGKDKTPNEGRYVDLPILFNGHKEPDTAWNLQSKMPAAPGERIAFYLYHHTDLGSASPDAYFRKPEGFNPDDSALVPFASPETASGFFADTAHVFPLGQFDLTPMKTEPRVVLEAAFFKDSPDGWLLIPNDGNPTDIFPEEEIAIHAREQPGNCSSCATWKPAPEGSPGRLYVERKISGQSARFFRDFSIGPSGRIRLKDLGAKSGDRIQIYLPYTSEKPVTWTEIWTPRDYGKKDQYQQRNIGSAIFHYVMHLPTLPPDRKMPFDDSDSKGVFRKNMPREAMP